MFTNCMILGKQSSIYIGVNTRGLHAPARVHKKEKRVSNRTMAGRHSVCVCVCACVCVCVCEVGNRLVELFDDTFQSPQ